MMAAKKRTLTRKSTEKPLKFTLDVEVKTKKDSHDVLMDLIERTEKALTRRKIVQVTDVRGAVVKEDEDEGDA